jgi:hypothetical protein
MWPWQATLSVSLSAIPHTRGLFFMDRIVVYKFTYIYLVVFITRHLIPSHTVLMSTRNCGLFYIYSSGTLFCLDICKLTTACNRLLTSGDNTIIEIIDKWSQGLKWDIYSWLIETNKIISTYLFITRSVWYLSGMLFNLFQISGRYLDLQRSLDFS